MYKVRVTQWDEGWLVDVDGKDRFVYKRLTDAIRRAGVLIGDATPLGQSSSAEWEFTDDFMNQALALARDRVELARMEADVARRTNEAIVGLAKKGLSNGDIAAVLGLTAARVSQIVQDTAVWLWGAADPRGDLQLVKLKLENGWRAGKGRGPLPDTLEFAGETYVKTGGASAVGGQPWRHTYVLKEG